MPHIVRIRIFRMYESCERTTYYVELRTDEGFTKTPNAYATGSVYTNFKGLSIEEARDRALMDAHEWADFLGLSVEPYTEDGVVYTPSMTLDTYTTCRELNDRK